MTESILDTLTPVETPMPEEVAPNHKAGKGNPFGGLKGKVSTREPVSERAVPKNKLDIISAGLPGVYQTLGAFTMMVDPVCGEAIINSADECAASLVKVARSNPKVANALIKLMEGGAWTGVAIAHAPIIFAVVSHHAPKKLKSNEVTDDGEATEEKPKGSSTLKFIRPPTTGNVS